MDWYSFPQSLTDTAAFRAQAGARRRYKSLFMARKKKLTNNRKDFRLEFALGEMLI